MSARIIKIHSLFNLNHILFQLYIHTTIGVLRNKTFLKRIYIYISHITWHYVAMGYIFLFCSAGFVSRDTFINDKSCHEQIKTKFKIQENLIFLKNYYC